MNAEQSGSLCKELRVFGSLCPSAAKVSVPGHSNVESDMANSDSELLGQEARCNQCRYALEAMSLAQEEDTSIKRRITVCAQEVGVAAGIQSRVYRCLVKMRPVSVVSQFEFKQL